MGSGYVDPHFLHLGTSWRWVVSFTPQPFYLRGKSPSTQWIGASLDDMKKRIFLTLLGPNSDPSFFQHVSCHYTSYANPSLTLLPFVSQLARDNVGASISRNLCAFTACYGESFTLLWIVPIVISVQHLFHYYSTLKLVCETEYWVCNYYAMHYFLCVAGKTFCQNCKKKCSGEVLRVQDKYFHINCFKCQGE
jgi:hypothetical protein